MSSRSLTVSTTCAASRERTPTHRTRVGGDSARLDSHPNAPLRDDGLKALERAQNHGANGYRRQLELQRARLCPRSHARPIQPPRWPWSSGLTSSRAMKSVSLMMLHTVSSCGGPHDETAAFRGGEEHACDEATNTSSPSSEAMRLRRVARTSSSTAILTCARVGGSASEPTEQRHFSQC